MEAVVEIVAAYITNHAVASGDIPALLTSVHAELTMLGKSPERVPEKLKPAVPVTQSVTRDYIVCLEDGRRFKTLKRHLKSVYGLTPDAYRARWGLAYDYPIVAPAYAESRAALARETGLGKRRTTAVTR